MRTNVVLNEDLLKEAARYARSKTKTGLIEEALATFVRVKAEEKRAQDYESRLKTLRPRLAALAPMRQSARDVVRSDRSRDG
jgi:hypothetical protein